MIGLAVTVIILVGLIFFPKPANRLVSEPKAVLKADTALSDSVKKNLFRFEHPYMESGHTYNDAAKHDSALYYFKEAAVRFEKDKNWVGYIWAANYISRLYLLVDGWEYKQAKQYIDNALKKSEKYLPEKGPEMAVVYWHQGLYLYKEGNATGAFTSFQKALQIARLFVNETHVFIAKVYHSMGDVSLNLEFNTIEAKEFYTKALLIQEKIPDIPKNDLIRTYYRLMMVLINLDDYEHAQSFCYKAIQIVDQLTMMRRGWQELLDGALGAIHMLRQRDSSAMTMLYHALERNIHNNGRKEYRGFYYTSLGKLYLQKGDIRSAIDMYTRAMDLGDTSRVAQADVYYGLGEAYLMQKKYTQALHTFTQCLQLRLTLNQCRSTDIAVVYQMMSQVYRQVGNLDSAQVYIDKAIRFCLKQTPKDQVSSSVIPHVKELYQELNTFQIIHDAALLGTERYKKKDCDILSLTQSLDYFFLADTLLTTFRSDYIRESSQLFVTEKYTSLYEDALDCTWHLYKSTGDSTYLNSAFLFVDGKKSSLLLEYLGQKEMLRQSNEWNSIYQHYTDLQAESRFIQSLLETEGYSTVEQERLHSRLLKVEQETKEIEEHTLKNKFPAYMSQRSSSRTSLTDLHAALTQQNTCVLEYVWGNQYIYILAMYQTQTRFYRISHTPEVDNHLTTLATILEKGYVSREYASDFKNFTSSSHALYQQLLEVVLNDLEKKKDAPVLMIIPDGRLFFVPFEILLTQKSVSTDTYKSLLYVLNSYTVGYCYAARFIQPPKKSLPGTLKTLGFAFSETAAVSAGHTRIDAMHELPGTSTELKEVEKYFGGAFYTGKQAKETTFKQKAPHYDIIHLALHGRADSINSYRSRLIFKSEVDQINDGNLYSYELYALPMQAKLAVLTACESGRGKVHQGEGVFSMARGFIQAGCASVVMSLWKVNDAFTANLVTDFYKNLSAGTATDVALREAKLHFLASADNRTSHPSYWAALIVLGNPSQVVKQPQDRWYSWVVIGSIAILLGYAVYKRVALRKRKSL